VPESGKKDDIEEKLTKIAVWGREIEAKEEENQLGS